MAIILSGVETAKVLDEKSIGEVQSLKEKGREPSLAVVRLGARPDDISYEKGILKKADKLGIDVRIHEVPDEDPIEGENKLKTVIKRLNEDDSVDGILLFRPLPAGYPEDEIINMIRPEKDVDGVTDISMAGVYSGSGKGYPPCTPQACIEILDNYKIDLKGKSAVVIGRSLVVGKPLAMMLVKRNATVTICHTKTENIEEKCRDAEVLFAAAGRAGVVTADYMSEGQVIVDVGINFTSEGKLTGDVDFCAAENIAAAVTPVPRGVGSVTTSVLLSHVINACKKKTEK
ncbi:MAG: bifunctional 5,10-methylenetetrahydrofolate dehydrogenase/5,10-methenyltetrahydrofolate cyclohydrolase [Lachnospiraceae bacterium]|jgi:methylenetetrahydrofolate dehydrogenase (NADP+)/methenyltetrahydrofolate cyclohydrolase